MFIYNLDLISLYRIHEKINKPLQAIEPFLKQLIESKVESAFLLSAYIDIYEQNAKTQNVPVNIAAIEMCQELADKQDAIREKYWNFKKQKLEKLNKTHD